MERYYDALDWLIFIKDFAVNGVQPFSGGARHAAKSQQADRQLSPSPVRAERNFHTGIPPFDADLCRSP
jgi:hypothetical protein